MEEKTDDIILKNNTEQIVSLIRSSLSVHEKRIQLMTITTMILPMFSMY